MAITDPPLTAFRFEVVIDLDQPTDGLSSPLCDAAFAECDGLEQTMQHKTIEVGGVNDRQVHLIGPLTFGQLSLKRGMTNNLQLWNWFAQGTSPRSVLTAHCEVTLWDSDGTPTIQATLTGCLPVKLRAPALNARDGLIAIEELTLVYEQLVVTAPDGPGGTSIGASVGFSAGASVSASASFSGGISAGASGGVSVGVGFG
jgi:phage tail-like protein